MASAVVPVSLSGGNHVKTSGVLMVNSGALVKTQLLTVQSKTRTSRNLSVRAQYDERSGGGSGADFVAGFLLGGAIRRSLLNEDEYGFRRAKKPIYYDEGLEKTRQTLNEKIGQLNSAIDNVSSRLRGGNNLPQVPVETDAEEAAL